MSDNRKKTGPSVAAQSSLSVVSTLYPLTYFAQTIGGKYVSVTTLTPAGVEPHDYEPTSQDIIGIYNAHVFIMNGGGIDVWADKISSDLQKKGVFVVDMDTRIQFMAASVGTNPTKDPHIWLDPVLAQREVGLIRDAFVKADPAHKEWYMNNADSTITQLQNLDTQYKTELASCRLKDIITSHSAFGYMAKRYGLNQISIAGLSPDAEPSAQHMSAIVQLAKQKKLKYIFFETLVNPKLSQTISVEVGAQTISFNPLEGLTDNEIKSGKTYLTEMKNNLENLKIALQCNK